MSKKALYLLGILLTIIIGTYFYWKLCCKDPASCWNKTDDKEIVTDTDEDVNTIKKTATSFPFSLKDGDFSFSSDDNFNFNTSGFSILSPISENLSGGIGKLQAYLNDNSDKSLDITGLYTSDEENTSLFPNLGLARANTVKNYLTSLGIPSSRMNLYGLLNDDMVADGTIFKGPIDLKLFTMDKDAIKASEEELEQIAENIKAEPLVLYFATGASSISLSPEQRQKIANIVRYLDKVDGSSVSVTGHTDNTGDAANNIVLGQERADFAKGYLVRNGIPEAKIQTYSKGQEEPIATNDTEGGRALNRRTVITIN